MMFKQAFVAQKLHQMQKYLDETMPVLKLTQGQILAEIEKLRFLERQLQLIVDTMLDINRYFIKGLNLEISDDLQGTFVILSENKILPDAFTKRVAPVVGLRNQLVYRYEKIDNKKFIRDFKKGYDDFSQYISLVANYLKKHFSE